MVYRKKRYSSKKKTYRRKRIFKKKRMMRSYAKADGGHLEKITRNFPMIISGGGTFSQTTVNWLATGASGAEEAFFTGGGGSIDTQFQQCQTMYREYMVSSLKIQYRPMYIDAGGAGALAISPVNIGTCMDRLLLTPIAVGEFRNSLDFKLYDPKRGINRFYRCTKYANTKLIKWRSTNDATTGATGGFHTLPNCQTVVHIPTTGIAPGVHIADLEVTWYVRFRSRQRA